MASSSTATSNGHQLQITNSTSLTTNSTPSITETYASFVGRDIVSQGRCACACVCACVPDVYACMCVVCACMRDCMPACVAVLT